MKMRRPMVAVYQKIKWRSLIDQPKDKGCTFQFGQFTKITCVMGSKLLNKAMTALDFQKIVYHCYTDSEIALQYIKQSPYRLKPFIANRVLAIHKTTNTSLWKQIGVRRTQQVLQQEVCCCNIHIMCQLLDLFCNVQAICLCHTLQIKRILTYKINKI